MEAFFNNLFSHLPSRGDNRTARAQNSSEQAAASGAFPNLLPNGGADFLSFLSSHLHYGEEAAIAEAIRASMAEQTRQSGPPPASQTALRQLPIIKVKPEDLQETVNRECSICFEANNLEQHVLRLPCAHIFHCDCIKQWLSTSNTCPVCRYELPTEDADYERGRLERMRHRRPRFAKHELQRMSVSQLKMLLKRPYRAVDKTDLIAHIVESGYVDVIPTPPPVEFRLAELQAMSISQIKSAMEEAGVFYYKRDVVEKDDLLRIFIMSGRLNVLSDEETQMEEEDEGEEEKKRPASTADCLEDSVGGREEEGFVVETVYESDDECTGRTMQQADRREDATILMEEDTSFVPVPSSRTRTDETGNASISNETTATSEPSAPNDATKGDEEEKKPAARPTTDGPCNNSMSDALHRDTIMQDGGVQTESSTSIPAGTDGAEAVADEAASSSNNASMQRLEAFEIRSCASRESSASSKREGTTTDVNDEEDQGMNTMIDAVPLTDNSEDRRKRRRRGERETSITSDGTDDSVSDRLAAMGISQLRKLARDHSVDISTCIERHEIINRLESANIPECGLDRSLSAGDSATSSMSIVLEELCVSEIRALAALVDVDLSSCSTQGEMASALQQATLERPHVAFYLDSLSPFVGKTVPQLQAVARHHRVDVSDCLEKGEIIKRLAIALLA